MVNNIFGQIWVCFYAPQSISKSVHWPYRTDINSIQFFSDFDQGSTADVAVGQNVSFTCRVNQSYKHFPDGTKLQFLRREGLTEKPVNSSLVHLLSDNTGITLQYTNITSEDLSFGKRNVIKCTTRASSEKIVAAAIDVYIGCE
jgi:hypothetical protein